jgi:CRISPR-associated protein Cas2
MRYMICYDIANTKTRTKVAKYLEGFAFRIQYSVFMCESNEKQMKDVVRRLRILTRRDNRKAILIVPLCHHCLGQMQLIGTMIENSVYCILA